jgi:heterodisulfide reductase subunit C
MLGEESMTTQHAEPRGSAFLNEVVEATPDGGRIAHCLQCGSCGGSCPSGADMQFTPRTLFALINADQRQQVLSANTMWCCVSCYLCTTRCPQEIPITEIMYALKRLAIRDRLAKNTPAPALAKTFTDLVERYGRSYEFGIATLYLALNKPLSALKMGPMGLSMFTKGRLNVLPAKIRNVDQLRAIIKTAREIGGAS